jgi:hypothetical protein
MSRSGCIRSNLGSPASWIFGARCALTSISLITVVGADLGLALPDIARAPLGQDAGRIPHVAQQPRPSPGQVLPDNLEGLRLTDKLEAIAELDLKELHAIDRPRAYGRD